METSQNELPCQKQYLVLRHKLAFSRFYHILSKTVLDGGRDHSVSPVVFLDGEATLRR